MNFLRYLVVIVMSLIAAQAQLQPAAGQQPRTGIDEPCILRIDGIDLVGAEHDHFARIRIRNESCTHLCRILAHVAVSNVKGDLNPKWYEGNDKTIAVPPRGEVTKWHYVPLETSGGGSLRIRAVVTSCDGESCAAKGVRVEPEYAVTHDHNIP